MGPRGGLSGAPRTAGGPPTGAALTLTSLTTSADLMTSTPISALATGYVNLKGEEDLYHKKRSGGGGAPGLRFLLITGSSVMAMAGVRPGALQGPGKAADLETNASLGILKTMSCRNILRSEGAFTKRQHRRRFPQHAEEWVN